MENKLQIDISMHMDDVINKANLWWDEEHDFWLSWYGSFPFFIKQIKQMGSANGFDKSNKISFCGSIIEWYEKLSFEFEYSDEPPEVISNIYKGATYIVDLMNSEGSYFKN